MINKYELTKAWHKLTTAQAVNERIAPKSGGVLHHTVFDVLCLIAHHPEITIQGVVRHPYFYNTSLSTIKRAIVTLLDEELIQSIHSTNDKRENLLSVVEDLKWAT